jgi:hypothetical protein
MKKKNRKGGEGTVLLYIKNGNQDSAPEKHLIPYNTKN